MPEYRRDSAMVRNVQAAPKWPAFSRQKEEAGAVVDRGKVSSSPPRARRVWLSRFHSSRKDAQAIGGVETDRKKKKNQERKERQMRARRFLVCVSLVVPPELVAILVVGPRQSDLGRDTRRARLAGHGCNTVDDVRSPFSSVSTRSPISPRCDSSRGLAAGVEFPQPGGGMGRGGSRRAMPDPVVALLVLR